MPPTADAVVIGGGVIGTSIAYHLAKARIGRVILLERSHLCAGTTGQSGAVIRQHYSNAFTVEMARDSLRVFRRWADEIGGDVGFRECGVLLLAGAPTEPGLRANVALQQALGIETRLLGLDDVRQIEPRLATDDLTLACWESTAGIADPVATVDAFAAAARRAGADIREGIAVQAIRTEGGQVVGVATSDGTLNAPIVVDAGNVWGARLLRPLGIVLPVSASRHPMAMLRRPVSATPLHPVVLDLHRQAYLIPRGPHTLAGSLATAPADLVVDPDRYLRGASEDEIVRFVAEAGRRMPSLKRAVVHGGWAGIYDETPDAHPILDEAPGTAGLFLALGFSGHGFKLAPAVGAAIARRIVDGPAAAPDLRPFRFDRFAEDDLIGANYAVGVLA